MTRKKLPSLEALEAAAVEITAMADAQHVAVALVGGLAMQAYGSTRLTADIDFAAARKLRGLPRGTPLAFGGVATTAPNGVPLDLIVRNDDFRALYEAAIDDAFATPANVLNDLTIVRPEYLAAMKMVAGRPKDEEDLRHLVTEPDVLSRPAAKRIIREYLGPYAVREFEAFCEEAAWYAARGKR